jgi:hypothetical protein
MLLNMKRLAEILRDKRIKNGGLDFDSLSGKVILEKIMKSYRSFPSQEILYTI